MRNNLPTGAILALVFLTSSTTLALTLFPASGAKSVNPDVQLRLTFDQPPAIGSTGEVRIYDAADGRLVDKLDLSIPPGPTERASEAAQRAPYTLTPYPYDELPKGRTNANTKPGTPTAGAQPPPPQYQLTIIGGFTDGFHFYPVIVDGKTAIIQPHHNLLEYGKSYYVEIDPGVLTVHGSQFSGLKGKNSWTFSTKPASAAPKPGATSVVVSADGSGDFNTVQGAMDWAPDHSRERITVRVNEGTYHEIVYFRNKDDVTIRAETPGKVRVTYANNERLNPHPENIRTNELPGTFPSRRAAFTVDHSNDIHLINLILETTCPGQAEGLLITGERNILSHVDVIGAGDALQVNGPTYIVDSSVTGTGDTILGRGPTYWERSTLNSTRVMMWIRNTDKNHGNVFHNCTFNGTAAEPTTLARAPTNGAAKYPFAEAVIIDSTLSGITPEGWGAAHDGGNAHFWEYNSRDRSGVPIDTSKRVAWSRQLDKVKDAEILRNYSNPAYVLGGWTPVLEK